MTLREAKECLKTSETAPELKGVKKDRGFLIFLKAKEDKQPGLCMLHYKITDKGDWIWKRREIIRTDDGWRLYVGDVPVYKEVFPTLMDIVTKETTLPNEKKLRLLKTKSRLAETPTDRCKDPVWLA